MSRPRFAPRPSALAGYVAYRDGAPVEEPERPAAPTPLRVLGLALAALDGAGGVRYLRRQAHETPGAFLTLLSRLLPLDLRAGAKEPVSVRILDLTPPPGLDEAGLHHAGSGPALRDPDAPADADAA